MSVPFYTQIRINNNHINNLNNTEKQILCSPPYYSVSSLIDLKGHAQSVDKKINNASEWLSLEQSAC